MNIHQAERAIGRLAVIVMKTNRAEEMLELLPDLEIEFENGQPVVRIDERPGKTCTWAEDAFGNWKSDCGNYFVLTDAAPYQYSMFHCMGCGGKLVEKKYVQPEESDDQTDGDD